MSYTTLNTTYANVVRRLGFFPSRREALKIAGMIVEFALTNHPQLVDELTARKVLSSKVADAVQGKGIDCLWGSSFADRFTDSYHPLDHVCCTDLIHEVFSMASQFSDWYMGDNANEVQLKHEKPMLGFLHGSCNNALIFLSVTHTEQEQGDSGSVEVLDSDKMPQIEGFKPSWIPAIEVLLDPKTSDPLMR